MSIPARTLPTENSPNTSLDFSGRLPLRGFRISSGSLHMPPKCRMDEWVKRQDLAMPGVRKASYRTYSKPSKARWSEAIARKEIARKEIARKEIARKEIAGKRQCGGEYCCDVYPDIQSLLLSTSPVRPRLLLQDTDILHLA
jgi:hypothetical protein